MEPMAGTAAFGDNNSTDPYTNLDEKKYGSRMGLASAELNALNRRSLFPVVHVSSYPDITPCRLNGPQSCPLPLGRALIFFVLIEKCAGCLAAVRSVRALQSIDTYGMKQQHHHHRGQSTTEDSVSIQRPPAPYGQACTGCSKAKCKCVRDAEAPGAACQRCRRLGRACQPSRITRKRGGGRPPNRTAQIEEKLESLVTLLRSQGQPAPPSADTTRVGQTAPSPPAT